MDKYIKLLLEQYSKVILPKFGAIVIENDENGELMFNEYLNYNDGKLDELIVKESNMELQEAQNMIAKYIRDIQAQIDKGESYDIFGLGSFSKNKDGEVEFSGNLKTGESKNKDVSAGPSPTPNKKEENKEEAPKKKEESPIQEDQKEEPKKKENAPSDKKENKYVAPADTSKEEKESASKSENKKEANAKSKDSKEKDKNAKSKKDAELKAEKQKAKKKADEDKAKAKAKAKKDKVEAKKAKAKAKEDRKKAKSKDQKPKDANQKDKKKRKVGVLGWIMIVLLFIVAGGTITAGVYYDEISDYMGWNEFAEKKEMAHNDMIEGDDVDDSDKSKSNDAITEDNALADTLETQNSEDNQTENSEKSNTEEVLNNEVEETAETKTEEPVKKPEPTPTYSTSTSNGSYHMIAGGFSVKSNAEDKVSELKGQGFDAKIIGRINGLHFVSVKSYSSLSAAKQDVSNIRSQFPDAWIYKK